MKSYFGITLVFFILFCSTESFSQPDSKLSLQEKGEAEDVFYTRGNIANLEDFSIKRIGEGNQVLVKYYWLKRQMTLLPEDFLIVIDSGLSHKSNFAEGFVEVDFPARILITYTIPNRWSGMGQIPVRFEMTISQPGNWEISLYN